MGGVGFELEVISQMENNCINKLYIPNLIMLTRLTPLEKSNKMFIEDLEPSGTFLYKVKVVVGLTILHDSLFYMYNEIYIQLNT